MKKLTDVYIKVTNQNKIYLRNLLDYNVQVCDIITFSQDNISDWSYIIKIGNRKKITLAELKRLIYTIPTREEIKRLKQQISAYKMNLSLVNERCKELQSDNDILVDCMEKLDDKLDIQADLIRDKNAQLEQLKNKKWWQIWK